MNYTRILDILRTRAASVIGLCLIGDDGEKRGEDAEQSFNGVHNHRNVDHGDNDSPDSEDMYLTRSSVEAPHAFPEIHLRLLAAKASPFTQEERSPLVLQGLDVASLLLLLLLPPVPRSRVASQPHQSSLPLRRRRTRSDGDGPDRVI